eukprot:354954-Chlamydomonas_euryale.AAC.3
MPARTWSCTHALGAASLRVRRRTPGREHRTRRLRAACRLPNGALACSPSPCAPLRLWSP